jgi:hypothetical protein
VRVVVELPGDVRSSNHARDVGKRKGQVGHAAGDGGVVVPGEEGAENPKERIENKKLPPDPVGRKHSGDREHPEHGRRKAEPCKSKARFDTGQHPRRQAATGRPIHTMKFWVIVAGQEDTWATRGRVRRRRCAIRAARLVLTELNF